MSAAGSRRSGIRRLGLGCGIALGLLAVAALAVAALVWNAQRIADPRADRHVVEDVVAADPGGVQEGAGAAATGPLRILLEMDGGETFVEPAAPGEPLTVQADYDAHLYMLEELDGGPSWDYRLHFRVTGAKLVVGLKEAVYGGQPQVRVRLPRDVPLALKLVQENGGAFVDLGGLDLRDVQVEFDGALIKVGAGEPLTGELGRFALRGGKAGAYVDGLANMRPRLIEVDFRMGEAQLDFRGAWERETRVDLQAGIADLVLRLPRGVPVEGLTTADGAPPAPEVTGELTSGRLRFEVRSGRRVTVRVLD